MGRRLSYTVIWCNTCKKKTRHHLVRKIEKENLVEKVWECCKCGTLRRSVRTKIGVKGVKMIPTSFHVPKLYAIALNRLVKQGKFYNMASAIRYAVSELLFVEERLLQEFREEDIKGITVLPIHLTIDMVKKLDELVELGVLMNRSSALRIAVRDLILRDIRYYKGLEFLSA